MKISLTKFWTAGLLALLIACAPAATQPPTADSAPTLPSAPVAGEPALGVLLAEATATLAPPTEAPLPAATSRGPNLEATDPATVNLASGGLQLVEFFRFT